MDKKQVRQHVLGLRLGLTDEEVDKKSLAICRKIIESDLLVDKNRICVYLAAKNEVDTKSIINFLIEAGAGIYLPKYFGKSDEYRLVRFSGWDDLEVGPHDIKQPSGDEAIDADKIDLAFVPGVAFDKKGTRLGYGKGVFDKLFAKSKATLVGLAYEFQVVDDLPREDHDLVMDFVVTPSSVIMSEAKDL